MKRFSEQWTGSSTVLENFRHVTAALISFFLFFFLGGGGEGGVGVGGGC